MELTADQISADVIKSILESAFIEDIKLNDDGTGLIANDDIIFSMHWNKQQQIIALRSYQCQPKASSKECEEFCKNFQNEYIMLKATPDAKPDEDGDYWIAFEYDWIIFGDDQVKPRSIVKLTRKFENMVRHGMNEFSKTRV